MALDREGGGPSGAVSFLPLTEETTTAKRRKQLDTNINMPPLPTLPFDILGEILCRIPVKLLLQLRCLCKSLNSLILDPKFATKHLRLSTTRHCLIVGSSADLGSANLGELVFYDSIIPSNLLATSNITQTKLSFPNSLNKGYGIPLHVCSCDGILCFTMSHGSAVLWNPSFRKSKVLFPLNNKSYGVDPLSIYSFGYDHFIHNYKIVAISTINEKSEVRVHTLGTDDWRRIQDFPYSRPHVLGIFVSGTVNWLTFGVDGSSRVLVSLDLEKESYQKLPQPNLAENSWSWTLGVSRECLCIFATSIMFFDVWIMREYGNKESWTKLYHVSHMENKGMCYYKKAPYISNNDQLLMDFHFFGSYNNELKVVVYDSKHVTWKIVEIQNIHRWMNSEVYIESLISPFS